MKVKTSITISEYILREMDNLLNQSGSRSSFIEQALLEYIQHHKKLMRDHKDLELINAHAEEMNEEADDILSFQVEF